MSFPKTCTRCSTEHTADSWQRLPYLGLMDDGDGGYLALRNCGCGTTLAIPATDEPGALDVRAA